MHIMLDEKHVVPVQLPLDKNGIIARHYFWCTTEFVYLNQAKTQGYCSVIVVTSQPENQSN